MVSAVKKRKEGNHTLKKIEKFAVIGGDMRQLVAARELSAHGIHTVIYGFDIYDGNYGSITKCASLAEALRGADCVLLPLPYSYDGVRLNCPLTGEELRVMDILSQADENAVIFTGKAPTVTDGRIVDYYAREEFSVLNAIPTAEGALSIAMTELPITVHGMRVGVSGFGRIGKTVSALFRAAGADVTVFARSFEALAWAQTYGCRPERFDRLRETAHTFDCIINTVPALVIDVAILGKMRQDTLIIDLASKPGGVDFAAAERLNIRALPALSLPGKSSPDTAGKIISETILNILCEKGVI